MAGSAALALNDGARDVEHGVLADLIAGTIRGLGSGREVRLGQVFWQQVKEEVGEAERELEVDVDAAKAELVAELRAIGNRLRQLEARL